MRRFADRLVRLTDAVAAAATAAIFALMVLQIVMRYGFNAALFWADEAMVWLLAWLVMLAAIGLVWQWRHVHVPMLLLAFPTFLRIPAIIVSKLLSVAVFALLVWYGYQTVAADIHLMSPGLGLSTRWFKLAIPVSATLMIVVAAVAIGRDIAAWRKGDRTAFERYGRDELPE